MRISICTIIVFFISVGSLNAQVQPMGGSSTGEAKVYASRRTTGITDPNAPIVFKNIVKGSGLENFRCVSGGKNKEYILETTACVVAVLDYDRDGLPDIYLLNGSTIEAQQGKAKPPRAALFRNLGNFKFEDVTAKAGVANERWGMGVTVGDYNNDGYDDIFVGNYGVARLYENNRDGTFTDRASEKGLSLNGWYNGGTFGDFDKDGKLDLFVASYIDFDLNDLPPSPTDANKPESAQTSFCQFRGQPVMCGPRGLKGGRDKLFKQAANGNFIDIGKSVGVNDEENYYGFSSVFIDIDNDNDLDLLVVNDSTAKQLYINDGTGKFEEMSYPSGIALNENGREQAGMGLGFGDYDNDGLVDFHITNFSDDSNTLYRNDGDDAFTDVTFQAGLGEPTIPFLGWGTSFFDYDNDGWLDIIVANGHVYPIVDDFQWGTSFAQQILLFRNRLGDGNSRFEQIGANPDSAQAESQVLRGLAVADFNLDGNPDVIANSMDSTPMLLANSLKSNNKWLAINLIGDVDKKSPIDATGSKVFLTNGNRRMRGDIVSGGSYASQNQRIIHFGLGAAPTESKIEIIWANGDKETISTGVINKTLVIEQGKGIIRTR